MNKVNFLPIEIKETGFRRRKILFNVMLFLLVMINLILLSHVFYEIEKIKKDTRKVSIYKDKIIKVNTVIPENNALVFFQHSINNNFNYDAVNINKNKITIKFNLKDKNEFIDYVNKIEKNKECKIEYLVAPYHENENYKFDVCLEVLK